MKIRSNFVSNSSTSSFICPPEVSVEDATKIMAKIHKVAEMFDLKLHEDDYTVFTADDTYGMGWDEWYKDEIKRAVEEGRTVVEEIMSNTFPFALVDLIEVALGARRLHFG